MEKIDIICPIFHVDLELFKLFLDSWFEHIPINYLLIGIGKKNHDLEDLLSEYPKIILFHQYSYKTLGYCLQELMECVSTEYFLFLHSDVEVFFGWYERMWESRIKGILESLKDPSFGKPALIQAKKYRAYSGAQLIYKKCIENLNFEDDYVYTNEDIIIQNIVLNRGFSYIKTPIYHRHYRIDGKRTQPKETILEWQWKGILKYAYPTSRLLNYIKNILKILKKTYDIGFDLETEIENKYPNWLPHL